MKEKVIKFIAEFVSYIITLTILVFIAQKAGWTGTSIVDNVIGLSIGWITGDSPNEEQVTLATERCIWAKERFLYSAVRNDNLMSAA